MAKHDMPANPPFTINISGRAEIPHPAERALIDVVVSSSGTNKAAVSDEVITTAKHIETLLRGLSPTDQTPEAKAAAPLAHWSKTSLSATSYVPYTNKNSAKPRQYDAKINFDIRFKEFKALGAFGSRLSALPHVEIHQIRWILTAPTEKSYRSQLRKEAAQDALQKAKDYCEVLGCTNIRPVELNESNGGYQPLFASSYGRQRTMNVSYPQMQAPQGFAPRSGGSGLFGSSSMQSASGPANVGEDQRDESELEFKPQEVRMSMEVSVQFIAE